MPSDSTIDDLIYAMNDVANDGQDLAMQLRELIADLPATSSLTQDLASNLSLFGRVLRELALYLGTPAAPYSSTTVEVIDATLDHAENMFDDVDDMMYRYEKDPDRDFHHRFRDPKVLSLSAKLESSRLTLAVMLQILQLRALMNLQEMEDGNDRSLRHRIKDLRLEAQSLVLDESWARRKEKIMEENDLQSGSLDDKPLMPRSTITEAAAAVTLLLEQLTKPYSRRRSRSGSPRNGELSDKNGRPRSYSQGDKGNPKRDDESQSPPKSAPLLGKLSLGNPMLEEIAKAALAAGVLGAWRSRSKVPVPNSVRDRKNRIKERSKPKHGQSILNGIGTKIEAIAPAALAAGAFEVFKNRSQDSGAKDSGKRFVKAARSAALGK